MAIRSKLFDNIVQVYHPDQRGEADATCAEGNEWLKAQPGGITTKCTVFEVRDKEGEIKWFVVARSSNDVWSVLDDKGLLPYTVHGPGRKASVQAMTKALEGLTGKGEKLSEAQVEELKNSDATRSLLELLGIKM